MFLKKVTTKKLHDYREKVIITPRNSTQQAIVRVNLAGDQYDEVSSALDGFLPVLGRLDDIIDVEMDCFPFYDILYACGATHVDVLFLDIQGAEFDVLKTIPWHYVHIRVSSNCSLINKRNKTK
jgi:hypothetical protein